MKQFKIFLIAVSILLITGLNSASAQCSMCRQSAESSLKQGKSKTGAGLNSGILYLMAIPYIMGAVGFGAYFYNERKKKKQEFQLN